jgi:hypothetical protein
MKIFLLLFIGTVVFSSVVSHADIIVLDNYLKRVESENPDIIAINLSIQAVWQKVL